ncbi:RQC-minor-1 family DNA-binding protein [Desulfotruncus alcoholivorax]|uniref:RQC-minor-1 family DNA-binding protein n=1 Tax=Desulfotruncus alcoholivorax TaxID=265477 RepID=UPI0003F6BC80|nr:RQC-minor-1 family DNA-binding protein [Desulfotruncus alcoholivorax]
MSKKKQRVRYHLDPKDIKDLSFEEIKTILRGADELIATGGRSLLAKILKGSKDKKLLEYGLDQSPVYGFYKELKIEYITARIDWLIKRGYLKIEYNGRLPVIVYTGMGWEIERDTYSDELLEKLRSLIPGGDYSFVNELKDRNRGMILLLLDKIKKSGEKEFIPLLEAWREIDYRKVREEIAKVINHLEKGGDLPDKMIDLRAFRQRRQNKD